MIKRAAAIAAIALGALIDIPTTSANEWMTFRADARLDTAQVIDLRSE